MFGKITIYKAPVYRVFAENVKLNEKGILIPDLKDEIISDEELFYSAYRAFVNINRDYVLLDRDEALDHIYDILSSKKSIITDLMKSGKGPQGESDFKKYLKKASSFIYFNESEIKRKEAITRKDFKELKKSYEKKN